MGSTDPLDAIKPARFVVEWNGENPIYGFFVRDTVKGETHGAGLTVMDALSLAADHERHVASISRLSYFGSDAEAQDWLPFDSDEVDMDFHSQAWPDQFEEWLRRRAGTWPA